MAILKYWVDPDVVGGLGDGSSKENAYSTLAVVEAARQGDYEGSGNIPNFHCTSSAGSSLTSLNISGWILSPTEYLLIDVEPGHEASKTEWGDTKARIGYLDPSQACIIFNNGINATHVVFENIQLWVGYSVASNKYITRIVFGKYSNEVTFRNCRLKGSAAGNSQLIYGENNVGSLFVENTVFTDGARAMFLQMDHLKCYNCSFGEFTTEAIQLSNLDNSGTIRNNAFYGTNSVFGELALADVQYNAAEDDLDSRYSETTNIQISDWSLEFENAAGGDFTILDGGNLKNAGIGPDGDSNVPTSDIDGDIRSGATTDIGADFGPYTISYLTSGELNISGEAKAFNEFIYAYLGSGGFLLNGSFDTLSRASFSEFLKFLRDSETDINQLYFDNIFNWHDFNKNRYT